MTYWVVHLRDKSFFQDRNEGLLASKRNMNLVCAYYIVCCKNCNLSWTSIILHPTPTSTSIYHTHIVLRSFILNETKTLESGPLPPQTLRGISKNSDFIIFFFYYNYTPKRSLYVKSENIEFYFDIACNYFHFIMLYRWLTSTTLTHVR